MKVYLVHMRFLISGFSQVWIRSESYHQNLRSTFTKPLLIVRFFLWLNEVKKNYTKNTKSCAFLINSFDETCFRTPYLFGGHHPWWASLQGICFSECVNLRWSFIPTYCFRNLTICFILANMLVPLLFCPTISKTHGAKLLFLQSPPFWTIVDKTDIDKDKEFWVKFRANS